MIRRAGRVVVAVAILLTAITGFAADAQSAAPHKMKGKFVVRPLKDASLHLAAIKQQSNSGTTIPLWTYAITSQFDNKHYTGQMVGRSPFFHGLRTTTVQTYLVPVILTFADTNTVFDPTTPDSCLNNLTVLSVTQNSPIFQTTDYVMNGVDVGVTQYVDGFQRANFWTPVSPAGDSYHTVLGLTTLAPISITVPATNGVTELGFCGAYGNMDINWWDALVQSTILPSLASKGVGPTSLPIFLFDSVVEYENSDPNQCCVLGYHNAYLVNGILQTYSITEFDTSGTFGGDISTTSHEVGEWMDDPLGTNPTPAWGNIGQVQGCQNNLEVGDPLSGTFFPPVTMNNFTYNPQELAFYSWFYRQTPSIGSGGVYSNNGTFTAGPPACP